jgi:hypothetical protein
MHCAPDAGVRRLATIGRKDEACRFLEHARDGGKLGPGPLVVFADAKAFGLSHVRS